MPRRYEAIRDSCLRSGKNSLSDCKTKAAKIYNATKKPGEPKLTNTHRQSAKEIYREI